MNPSIQFSILSKGIRGGVIFQSSGFEMERCPDVSQAESFVFWIEFDISKWDFLDNERVFREYAVISSSKICYFLHFPETLSMQMSFWDVNHRAFQKKKVVSLLFQDRKTQRNRNTKRIRSPLSSPKYFREPQKHLPVLSFQNKFFRVSYSGNMRKIVKSALWRRRFQTESIDNFFNFVLAVHIPLIVFKIQSAVEQLRNSPLQEYWDTTPNNDAFLPLPEWEKLSPVIQPTRSPGSANDFENRIQRNCNVLAQLRNMWNLNKS